ncbi:MAG: GGDEF domain-containing protein [Devosia sp.]|uniref:GGDEF domain-containing protein n=1 Tax=Devosia sp. TaxID=1871048 RepID=UPI001ACA4E93|nr:GGDEF domain-containing protein [Devosia sp.]MBN9314811.1 GGDEF domain-containing protein [Devosia sp.]
MGFFGAPKRTTGGSELPAQLPDPGRLMAGSVAAMLLLALTVVFAAYYAMQAIDRAAIADEIERAERALLVVGSGPGTEARLQQDFVLDRARFVAPSGVAADEVSVPAPGRAEVLAWTPRRIGSDMFLHLAPLRLAATGVFLFGIFTILRKLLGMTRELERRRRDAHELALHDALTGLGNRLAFDGWIEAAAARGVTEIGLLYLDLDDFKAINDRMGHGAGDELLKTVAQRLANLAGDGDLVARMGGDEFAFVRQGPIDRAALAEMAADIGTALSEPIPIGAGEVALGSSLGAAVGRPGDPQLVAAADAALYRAKALPGHTFALAEAA